jgi:hypothetical protein
MIAIRCTTCLDDYSQEVWPKVLCCKPSVGEYIESASGKHLVIRAITHKIAENSNDPILLLGLYT